MRESWTTFTTNTTLHGLRYVFLTSGIRRLIWASCLLAVLGGYLWLLYDSIKTYTLLPINTQVSYEHPDRGMPFPQLTICNLNAVVKSKANVGYNDPHFERLHLDLPVCQVVRNVSGNLTCGQALICIYEEKAIYLIPECNNITQRNLRQAVDTPQRIFNPEEFLWYYGHDFHKMFRSHCQLGEVKCNADDFYPVMTRKGLCFSLNVSRLTARAGARANRIHFPGVEFGLSIILDALSQESTFGDWSVGFRVVISEEGVGVNRDEGFNIHPGSHVIAALSPEKIHRLPHPYKSNCAQRYLPGYQVYSKNACLSQCISNKTMKDCGCRSVAEPGFPDIPVCSISDKKCFKDWQDNPPFKKCQCLLPCEEIRYPAISSSSKFPTTLGKNILKQDYKIEVTDEYIKENLVFLQVGFERTSYEVIVQSPAYGSSSLFGDIGGNMGLMLGCSILTVVEFIDFAIMFVVSKFQSKANKIENIQ